MSIIKEVSLDLHNTVKFGEHIEKIYFTAEGHHYINRHEFIERVEVKRGGAISWADKPTGEYYGWLLHEIKEETSITANGREHKRSFVGTKRNPAALIVETLTRDQVLALPTFKPDWKALREIKETQPSSHLKENLK